MLPTIKNLKNLCIETRLAHEGRAEAVVLIPRQPFYETAAHEIQRHVKNLAGCDLPIRYDSETTIDVIERNHLIVLGNLCTNKLVESLYRQWYTNVDLGYPGRGGHVVRSIHNPWGTGKNVILLGGSDDAGVKAATRAFLRVLPQKRNPAVGWLSLIRLGREVLEEMESKPHYRGPVCDGGFKYYFSGEEKYGRIYREALLERVRMDDPFELSHIWFWEPLVLWDLLEESPVFSNHERLIITNLFLQWIESHEGRNHAAFRLDLRLGNLSQSHRTSPALACFFGARYFKKYYGLKRTKAWFSDATKYFAPQMISSKTIDEPEGCTAESLGCGGLMTYAFAKGDFTCFENGTIREAADRVAMCCNNLGVMAAYADVQSFYSVPSDFFCRAAHYTRDGAYEFMACLKNPWGDKRKPVWREYDHPTPAFHTDVTPCVPKRLMGVRVARLSRVFWDTFRGNYAYPDYPKTIPYSRSFDKISFRNGFGPEDDYLLLDGVSGGVHGHADANSILEYTSRDRLWIVTADLSYGYDNSRMSHHNAVTVLRDGEGELPPGFAALEKLRSSPRGGYAHTVLPKHNGVDWHRKITWLPGRHFLVNDVMHVRKDGEYRFDCRWRTLGEPGLEGRNLIVDQKGVQLHIENCGAQRLELERDEFRGSYFTQWAKKKYAHADPILNILTQTITGRFRRGEVVRFANLIRISSARRVRTGSPSRRSIPGSRGGQAVGPALRELWKLKLPAPIRDVQAGAHGILLALASGSVALLDQNGRQRWQRHLGAAVGSVAVGDINGDGANEIVAGADDARLYVLSAHGKLLWKHKMPALDSGNLWALPTPRVVRVRCADLDGDGCDEIVAGVGNLHLHVLAGDGRRLKSCLDWARTGLRKLPSAKGATRELWRRFSWGTWNTFDFADLNGDGRPEIIGGPGMPPKSAASPGWILKFDGDVLAELNLDGWSGGLNALVIGDLAGEGKPLVALGTMKGWVRLLEPPKHLGRKLRLKPGQVVVDHTSGHNATFILRPPKLRWERNLGDLITGLVSISDGRTGRRILVVGSSTGFVTAFDANGRKLWFCEMGSEVTSMLAGRFLVPKPEHVAVACRSGEVRLFDGSGQIAAVTRWGPTIAVMSRIRGTDSCDDLLLAGKENELACFRGV